MGNIKILKHQGVNNFTRSFNYGNNLLNSIAVGGNNYTFEYDVCGNQTRENQERQFDWDYADRMKLYYNQVNPRQEPSTYAHYLYDAGGSRVQKLTRTQGGNWECTTYIDGLIEYREDNTGQKQSISHIMEDSKRIASIRKGHDFENTTPEVKYNMDDHLGSSNLSIDENGTLVNREEYYPFGETSFGSYGKKRYRFCGKEKDEESGLYYCGARYYSPWSCRFISVDPQAGKYVFQTPYAYADNNPICKMDYNGEGTGDAGGEPTKANAQPADQNQSAGTSVVIHQVKKNETLGGIAKKYGTSVDALRKANNLDPKNDIKLQIGTKLNIPQASVQSNVNSSFKFNFEMILPDNSRYVAPITLGLNTPKSGVSGGFSGQFMRMVMGNEPASSGSGGPFRKISLGGQSSVKWGPATVISTSQLSQSQGPFSYSSKITISTRIYLTNTPLGKNEIVPDAEVFFNFQISNEESVIQL
ncbi:MAG: RHS repeat-associated core domain-containing protein [Bacteroidota bacterium]|nr:RHS repeat-associated core domain-containing protein [Bacteroidota bacterium]